MMLPAKQIRMQDIARLTFSGYTTAEIALRLNVSPSTVNNARKEPLYIEYLHHLNEAADAATIKNKVRLSELVGKALDVLDDILSDNSGAISPSIKLRAAQDVMNRNNYNPEHNVRHTHTHVDSDMIKGILARAKDCGIIRTDDTVIEVTANDIIQE